MVEEEIDMYRNLCDARDAILKDGVQLALTKELKQEFMDEVSKEIREKADTLSFTIDENISIEYLKEKEEELKKGIIFENNTR